MAQIFDSRRVRRQTGFSSSQAAEAIFSRVKPGNAGLLAQRPG